MASSLSGKALWTTLRAWSVQYFANYFHILLGTVRDWEQGKRKMPEYVYELIEYKASKELLREKEENDE